MKFNHEGTKERKHEKEGLKVGDRVNVRNPKDRHDEASAEVVAVVPPYCKVLVRFSREMTWKKRVYRIEDVEVLL